MTRPPQSPASQAALADVPEAPTRSARLLAASQPAVPPAAQREALADVASAFGQVLQDLQFSFVVSSARAEDMPIVYASPGFFTCTGYSAAEVLGRNCRFLQGPATSHQAVMEIRDAIREERPCSVCLLNYRKDKSRFWNYFRLEPVRRPCGTLDYFVGVQADVTRLVEAAGGGAAAAAPESQEAAAAEAAAASVASRLAGHQAELAAADCTQKCAVLECVPSSLLYALSRVQECFVLSDPNLPDCPIVYASPAFLAMSGYCCGEVVGRNCRFLQGPGTCPDAVQQLRDALSADPPRSVSVVLLNYKKSGEPFWNCLHISPLRDADGRVQYFAGCQCELKAEEGEEGQQREIDEAAAAAGSAAAPEADPIALLRQKGVVGSLRVATRALAQHGLRRAAQFQHPPISRAD